jgi:hypothetical protein
LLLSLRSLVAVAAPRSPRKLLLEALLLQELLLLRLQYLRRPRIRVRSPKCRRGLG